MGDDREHVETTILRPCKLKRARSVAEIVEAAMFHDILQVRFIEAVSRNDPAKYVMAAEAASIWKRLCPGIPLETYNGILVEFEQAINRLEE